MRCAWPESGDLGVHLHNVGNVLNSVNVSATLIADHVRHSKAGNILKLAALFEERKTDLANFLTQDPRGRMIPGYLATLAEELVNEQASAVTELENLRKNIEHIKEIVSMQQSYARTSGVMETVSVPDLVEDALRINAGSLARHEVDTLRDYRSRTVITSTSTRSATGSLSTSYATRGRALATVRA